MLATWIETAAKGRLGGPVRAGMWSTAVIGTHPIQDNQRVRLEQAPFDHPELPHYHWHIEVIPRLTKVAGFEWGSGFYINPVPPEHAAAFLRDIEVNPPAPEHAPRARQATHSHTPTGRT